MPGAALPVKHLLMELRYDPTLVFYAKMDPIGIDFSDAYPDWERSPLTLEIRNKKHHRRCFLSHRRAFYEAVGFPAEGPEYDRGKAIFERLHHDLKFTRVRRLGIRQWLAIPADEPFDNVVKVAAKRFHPQSDALEGMLRGKVEDLAYVANVLTAEGWKYRLNVGPMERKQWFEVVPHEPKLFESQEDLEKYREAIPERMFFIDMDSFREDIAYADVAALIASVRGVSAEILADLVKYLKG